MTCVDVVNGFSLSYYKNGIDQLMRWASFCCSNFLCVVFAAAFLNGVPLVELTLRPDLSSNCDIRTHARSCCCCFLSIVYTQASFVSLVLVIRFALSFCCDTPTHACARARTHAHTHTHTHTHTRTHARTRMMFGV